MSVMYLLNLKKIISYNSIHIELLAGGGGMFSSPNSFQIFFS